MRNVVATRVAVLSGSTLLMLFAGAQVASAAEIAGVWSFNGGEIGVRATGPGQYEGIVVSPTKFAICPHPVGERIWSGMTDNGDGSYTGQHQWYYNETSDTATCRPTSHGKTTYRVVEPGDGTRFLHVCFTAPPELAGPIDGGEACVDSKLVAELPSTTDAIKPVISVLGLGARSCISRRAIRIHLSSPPHDPLAKATITLQGRHIKVLRGSKWSALVNLRGKPKGRYSVDVDATTVLGRHIQQRRMFRTCTPKGKPA